MPWVAVPIVAANLGIVSWLSRRLTPRQTAARTAPVLAVALAAIVIPHSQAALWVTLGVTALAAAICLPAAAAIVSAAVAPDQQGLSRFAEPHLEARRHAGDVVDHRYLLQPAAVLAPRPKAKSPESIDEISHGSGFARGTRRAALKGIRGKCLDGRRHPGRIDRRWRACLDRH